MKAAIVRAAGQTPVYSDFDNPQPQNGEARITVTAAALSHLVRGRASGQHYSASGQFPFVAGVDGVGRLEDGRRVYFMLPRAPFGSMAEFSVAPERECIDLPDDLDDVTAAAIVNPGVSSWAALAFRAGLQKGQTVLVNGATGTSGRLAVQIARYLGASKVIAVARDAAALAEMAKLGADVTIPILSDANAFENALKPEFAAGVDVIVDYLWGRSAETLLTAAAKAMQKARPLRYVEVGAIAGQDITLPGAVLRSSAIELMGSGLGSVSSNDLIAAAGGLLRAVVPGGFRIATNPVALSQVEHSWIDTGSKARTVFLCAD